MNDQVVIFFDESMIRHDPGPGHPERPARLQAIRQMLADLQFKGVKQATPKPATRSQVQRIHDSHYIDEIDSLRGKSTRLDEDTAISPASVDAAFLAAGAAINAVETVVHNKACRAFALVRPPGHHAERDRAMGFCLFNNIAIAAAHAIAELGCQRVLIVDWDVHHGNGTQHAFENRSDVLFFSSHQSPLYPGTGALEEVGIGTGKGFTVNAPLPAGFHDTDYIALFEKLLVPIADAYKPDLVLVSAGFDAHRDDPLAGMRMTEDGFASLCGIVRNIADRQAQGRLALILEGGYNLNALANSTKACIEILAGSAPPKSAAPDSDSLAVVDKLCASHRRHWPI